MAHQAWLDTTPEKWKTSRRKSAKISAAQRKHPEVKATRLYIDALYQLGVCQSHEYGVSPLSWQEINNWRQAVQVDFSGYELEIIRSLSETYAHWCAKSKTASCRSPLEAEIKTNPDDIEKKLRAQFKI